MTALTLLPARHGRRMEACSSPLGRLRQQEVWPWFPSAPAPRSRAYSFSPWPPGVASVPVTRHAGVVAGPRDHQDRRLQPCAVARRRPATSPHHRGHAPRAVSQRRRPDGVPSPAHRVLNAIPDEGMTKDEFYRLVRPFVAAVGDAHTHPLPARRTTAPCTAEHRRVRGRRSAPSCLCEAEHTCVAGTEAPLVCQPKLAEEGVRLAGALCDAPRQQGSGRFTASTWSGTTGCQVEADQHNTFRAYP